MRGLNPCPQGTLHGNAEPGGEPGGSRREACMHRQKPNAGQEATGFTENLTLGSGWEAAVVCFGGTEGMLNDMIRVF